MANFTPSKKTAQDFNGGVAYVDEDIANNVQGDAVQAETINSLVESALFTQGLAVNAPDTSEADNVGTPTVELAMATDGTARLKFSNLKGKQGERGQDGTQGVDGEQGVGIANLQVIYDGTTPMPRQDRFEVGDIFISMNSTSPATRFGGYWQQIKGRFLLGASDAYPLNDTGGEATHTLTIEEMPSHSHPIRIMGTTSETYPPSPFTRSAIDSSETQGFTREAGGGQSHNNMPPYLAVYIWRKTAD